MAANQDTIDYSLPERRRYKREHVALAGRQFEPVQNLEADCRIADISPGGARILSQTVPPVDTRVIVYIEGLGRFEGDVVRLEDGAFGLRFNATVHKRERVAEQLEHYVKNGAFDKTALRRHRRIRSNSSINVTRANGDVVNCTLVDFSLSGVSLLTDSRPPVGELVLIGQIPGRIARHHDNGISIEYMTYNKAVEPARYAARR